MTEGATPVTELAALARDTFVEAYAADLDRNLLVQYARDVFVPELLEELAAGVRVQVVRMDGRAVAYGTAGPVREADGTFMRLGRLYVEAGHRRHGLGSQLVDWVCREASACGLDEVRLGVWEANHRAIAFYEALGFVRCGAEAFVLGGMQQRDLVMRRPARLG